MHAAITNYTHQGESPPERCSAAGRDGDMPDRCYKTVDPQPRGCLLRGQQETRAYCYSQGADRFVMMS